SGGTKRSKQSTPAVFSSIVENRSNSGKKRSKQSTPAVVSSIEEKRVTQTSSKVNSIEEKRSKQSTPAVVSTRGKKRSEQTSSSEVSSGGKKRSKQSTPAVVSSIEEKRLKQISSKVTSIEVKRSKQSTPAVVSSRGKKRSEQSTPKVVSSIEEKRLKQISLKVTNIEEKRSKQSTPAVVSSRGIKSSKQTSSSEVRKERENSASSGRSAREKTEKIQAGVKYKTYVSVLLDKLITQIYKKAKVTCADDDTRRHLLERIWAEVKDIDSTFIPKRSPYEAILKDFCEGALPAPSPPHTPFPTDQERKPARPPEALRRPGSLHTTLDKTLAPPSLVYSLQTQPINAQPQSRPLKVPTTEEPNNTVNFRELLLIHCQREVEKDKVELQEAKYITRWRSTGNIKFIGELFKVKMLNEPIIHDCLVKLLTNYDEVSLECLCRLLTTIGKDLDSDEAKASWW
ncbi:unnamed protein product, partial [Pleuronectes platessa]